MASQTPSVTVEPKGAGQWLVRAKRSCAGGSATGEVVIRQAARPGDGGVPYATLAGGRAYLALGRSQLASGKVRNAVDCARAGLDELGSDYVDLTASDDTDLKLFAAEDRIDAGEVADGAETMLRVLEDRIATYERVHSADLVPVKAP